MKQPQAEHILKQTLEKRGIKQLYNTARENKENNPRPKYLLDVLHRETSIPKSQIVSYLNNRHGYEYACDEQQGLS